MFTLEQVAEHHSPDDCWMAIHGKVYDLTPYVPNHPGPDLE
ncbi:cytochrome b5-like heme/steroid binding domain-containing protein [Serratia marcescens]|nr:cytochrome b5-like heme/steroid binding domain-containing protein [Serratia marcescens]